MIKVFAGSFDPFTAAHEDIARRALALGGELHIVIAQNQDKTPWMPANSRQSLIEELFPQQQVKVVVYEGLIAEYCAQLSQSILVRGIRNTIDWEYEKGMARNNSTLGAGIDTLFFATKPEWEGLSSSLVRDLCHRKKCPKSWLPISFVKELGESCV